MRKTDKHTFFFTKYDPFSNWHIAPCHYHGVDFNCGEQFMMYCKAMLFKDNVIAQKILDTPDPKTQKALGRQVAGFKQDIWEAHCQKFVKVAARARFTQHERLYDALMDTTGTKLVEASKYDRIWGIGMDENAPGVDNEANWPGENRLGNILTELREELALLPRPNFRFPNAKPRISRLPGM